MCIGVAVVPFSEVTVEGGDDGVGSVIHLIFTLPLSNTGSAGIGDDGRTRLLKVTQDTVTLSGVAYLLRPGVVEELRLHRHTLVMCLSYDGDSTGKIFI